MRMHTHMYIRIHSASDPDKSKSYDAKCTELLATLSIYIRDITQQQHETSPGTSHTSEAYLPYPAQLIHPFYVQLMYACYVKHVDEGDEHESDAIPTVATPTVTATVTATDTSMHGKKQKVVTFFKSAKEKLVMKVTKKQVCCVV